MYSLGAVLFELLCGRPPFVEVDERRLLGAHVTKTPVDVRELRSDVPQSSGRLIAALLDKNSEARPSARQVATLLDALRPDPPGESFRWLCSRGRRSSLRPGVFYRWWASRQCSSAWSWWVCSRCPACADERRCRRPPRRAPAPSRYAQPRATSWLRAASYARRARSRVPPPPSARLQEPQLIPYVRARKESPVSPVAPSARSQSHRGQPGP